ncbi:aminomethyl-transferring glycine dehydrogenase [Rhodovibrionaceae bacterium A322]
MSATRKTLEALENQDEFISRHNGPSADGQREMLRALGLDSLDQLVDEAVPEVIRAQGKLDLPGAMTESQLLAEATRLAGKNEVMTTLIGLGYHDCIVPPVIQRNVLENPGWYTAYTPYQAEIAQGRLEALVNFQQMIMDLTGMELASASLLDEGTAAAEAMTLMQRVGKAKSNKLFVAEDCFPQTLAVIETRAVPLGIEVQVGNPETDLNPDEVFGVILQYTNTDGEVRDYRALVERIHQTKALVTVACDLLSLALLTPPGEWGADVVIGSSQRFGVPLGYGGPHAAFMAFREAYKRTVPGRIIGVSIDRHGNPAYRLALQTREQHIRRDKATSNICTAQVLLAVMAGFYAVWHGQKGIKRIAGRVHRLTDILATGLKSLGVTVETQHYFDSLVIQSDDGVIERALAARINLRDLGNGRVGLSLNEKTTRETVETLWAVLSGKNDHGLSVAELDKSTASGIPAELQRTSEFLTHSVFTSCRSETEMLRYLRQLREKDVALDRSMIPLGSCTMKLNATAEMMPITLPGFSNIHPFVPADQATGYKELIDELESMLCTATGFAAVTLQPNAGSQGEYAGLLAIRGYHEANGDHHRNICIIPSSAHGTNPASAVLAGMKVVVVNCDDQGNVDLEDLQAKCDQHAENLSALMITYPSTHGVFEESIRDICAMVHDKGGQVYMDGANFNALLGLAYPGDIGADVMHMNLHKTFCIPHGGGGPGVGPIGVAAHLVDHLPGHNLIDMGGAKAANSPVSSAPWGSASILPISWAYMKMMGGEGLTLATKIAILNANYMAKKLGDHFPVLYTGKNGYVAHECIIDTRPLKDETGVTVDDIAKRLMDFGFHAPTMSWPVAGTLMIEPTESESKRELDQFIEAMAAIRAEAAKIEDGTYTAEDNPLVNAPHTAEDVMSDDWTHCYSRQVAAYPVKSLITAKYWPPVGRVDNVYGDRHLVCSCPAVEDYREAAE